MTIRAVLFDLGDTLIKLHPMPDDFPARFDEYLARERLLEVAPRGDELFSLLRDQSAALQDHREAVFQDILAAILSDARLADSERHAAALALIMHEGDVARFEWPPLLLEEITLLHQQGLRFAIVSNTTTDPSMMLEFLHSIGIAPLFDAHVFSVQHGYKKPAPSIYAAALDSLAVTAQEAVFIGDRVLEDVRGPQSAGMRGVLMHRFRQENPAGVPDAVVASIEEFDAAIERFNSASDG